MLKTGTIIAERYEILEKIGTGGMADVYKAKDHKLNRFVAVKVLKSEFREDTTFIKKFRSEAQAAAVLTHPNIVNVFDVGDDEGVYYIVMELIEGITLKEYISKKGKLSIKEATSIAIQVSMGLEAAHSHGIVHRDVKPQNIIISMDGKVKVTDFGIARAASSNTISSNVMGSVHYSSPEQVRGGYSDEKSDIYSLGITLYEMVTGRVPFDGDTTVAIAIKHLQEEMVPPSVYTPELPHSLEQIILKCTQKSVDRRYQNMEDVIADLKHSLIDPQGDFVKSASVDNDAKTVVISDKELGEIKHMPKQIPRPEAEILEKEINETDYDDEPDEMSYKKRTGKSEKHRKQKKPHYGLTIAALFLGAVVFVAIIILAGRASGLIGKNKPDAVTEQPEVTKQEEEDMMVEVPDLVGKTENEARELTNELHLGLQMMGEENSNQEKGKISSQDIPKGTKVQAYSTIKYYISKGAQQVSVPDVDGRTGIDAQQMMEDMGLNVIIQKEYSELDDNGYPIVNPGYAYYTNPEAGTTVNSGDSVTLVISRGVDYGDSIEVPSVVGMTKNDAITTLGKFLDIQVKEERNPEVAAGEVTDQSMEAGSWENPDSTITITVSTGDQEPGMSQNTDETDTSVQENQAAASGEVWKCTQSLNTPTGYSGGPVRLELVQNVNGNPAASVILDGETIQFPYDLDITGAPGVSEGTLYLSELIDGTYQELGHYPITFAKAE
ncbi:MAG: Stk1 family PASTA domain-containing Ser/Thr kinase [Clostridia bacterium]|nr:Stk1 family PASTA domain-containing Ser/Thr kinase [Clostridia bacterium]MDY5553902.1 Stk1 family PASTA domain-containing Ser/Thr kinase [Blautia sp.]